MNDVPSRTVDLFSGCGGMSLGFERAEYKIVAGFDNWAAANCTYDKNFSHDCHFADLADEQDAIARVNLYQPEVIIGGPPCQDFSIAGKQVEGSRANLTLTFANICTATGVELAVMENVSTITKSETLSKAVEIFHRTGYGVSTTVIDASRVGVPQMRKRFFLIAARGSKDGIFEEELNSNLTENRMTVGEYFGDEIDFEHYYAHPRSYARRAIFSIHEPSATIRQVNRPIPATYKFHPADKLKSTDGIRALTTSERSQIQTFPKSFEFCGTRSQQEIQIANSVPPNLAFYVAISIRNVLKRSIGCVNS